MRVIGRLFSQTQWTMNVLQAKMGEEKDKLLVDAKDVLSDWLDSKFGKDVTENGIFSDLPRQDLKNYHMTLCFI